MKGVVSDYGAAILSAGTALFVAILGIVSAEGGRQRRLLKRAREALELATVLREKGILAERASELERRGNEDLDEYLLSKRQRLRRLLDRVALAALAASVYFFLVSAVQQRADAPSNFLLNAVIVTTLGFLIVAMLFAMRGVAVIADWADRRLRRALRAWLASWRYPSGE